MQWREQHAKPIARSRAERLLETLHRLEENRQVEIQANQAYEAWWAARAAGGVPGQKLGMPPKPVAAPPVPAGVMNKTDHDSRMMRTNGQPTVQGYNAQVAVTRGQIIIAAGRSRLPHGADLPVDQRSTPVGDFHEIRPGVASEEVDDAYTRCGIRNGVGVDVVGQKADREHAFGLLTHLVEMLPEAFPRHAEGADRADASGFGNGDRETWRGDRAHRSLLDGRRASGEIGEPRTNHHADSIGRYAVPDASSTTFEKLSGFEPPTASAAARVIASQASSWASPACCSIIARIGRRSP